MLREMTKTTWRATLTLLLVLSAVLSANAQSLSMDYLRYIEQWSPLAVRHQQQYGIPASITLSQGLLESCAGLSRLATEGNNHFGIKCHKDWTGDGIYADDDEKNECFRKYTDASESFEDHARFLKRKRYQPLFQLKETDYAGWAAGLKQCGYATDPSYAAKLVNIIETYELYKYDTGQPVVAQRRELRGDETMEHTIDMAIVNEFKIMHKIRQKWGLYYVTVYPGDTYDSIAEEFGMKKRKLLDAPFRSDALPTGEKRAHAGWNARGTQGETRRDSVVDSPRLWVETEIATAHQQPARKRHAERRHIPAAQIENNELFKTHKK